MESPRRASASPLASHAAFLRTFFLPVYTAQRLLPVPVEMGVGHPCRAISSLSLKLPRRLFGNDGIGNLLAVRLKISAAHFSLQRSDSLRANVGHLRNR